MAITSCRSSGIVTRVSEQAEWAVALDDAILHALEAMSVADNADWSVQAGDLEWDCRATVRHVAGAFIGYAGQLTSPRPEGWVPFDLILEGTPSPSEIRDVLQATGGILSSVVRTTASGIISFHSYGIAGPKDFAAMGILELFVHTEDLSRGLGFVWSPPAELCSRVLAQLFLNAPQDHEPWPTLLWCTGRIPLGELPRQKKWRWVNTGS
jgi:hypothetical protein